MSGRTLIVGDIHGCLDELRALLEKARFGAGDRLISVGDLVGKGPDGAGVVRFFREGGHDAVLGNHDDKLLRWRASTTEKKKKKKKKKKKNEPEKIKPSHRRDAEAMTDEDWAWLEALPLYIEIPEHDTIVVHAGLVPGVPLAEQRREDLLHMRTLRPDGTGSSRQGDGEPWAARWRGPQRVVFGHDAMRGLQRWPRAVGLDTGCCYGGRLSGLLLPDNRVISERARSAYEPVETMPVRVCEVDDLDRPRTVISGLLDNGRPREVIVVRTRDGEPRAYVNVCMHLPVPLDGGSREFLSMDERSLMCGTHGALYRFEDGYCFEGPCEGTSLEPVSWVVDDDGWVIVDV